jgi:ribonuclease P protein component
LPNRWPGKRPIFTEMPKRFGFSKAEHLKSRKQIDGLFENGKAVSAFPVRAIYRFLPAEKTALLVGVSASKKNFKKAVDRNRLKRLLREAYRLQKEELAAQVKEAGKAGNIFFIYTDKTIADFETVKTAMGKCLQRLSKLVANEDPS